MYGTKNRFLKDDLGNTQYIVGSTRSSDVKKLSECGLINIIIKQNAQRVLIFSSYLASILKRVLHFPYSIQCNLMDLDAFALLQPQGGEFLEPPHLFHISFFECPYCLNQLFGGSSPERSLLSCLSSRVKMALSRP